MAVEKEAFTYMAVKTPRLGLNKTEPGDYVRQVLLEHYGENWDIIDTLCRNEDFERHRDDSSVHVAKDGTLQVGLNAEMVGGLKVSDLSAAGHNHNDLYYTKTESDGRYPLRAEVYTKEEADQRFALDSEVYKIPEADALFARKADVYLRPEADSTFAKATNVYTKAESDARYPLKTDVYTKTEVYTKAESDARYPLKTDVYTKAEVYTKTESDQRFALISDVYTKTEAGTLFALKDAVYAKAEADSRFAAASAFARHQHALQYAVTFNDLSFYWLMDVSQSGVAWSTCPSAYGGLTMNAAGADFTAVGRWKGLNYSATLVFAFESVDTTAQRRVRLVYDYISSTSYCYAELEVQSNSLRVARWDSGTETALYEGASGVALEVRTVDQVAELGSPPSAGPLYVLHVDVENGQATVRFGRTDTSIYDASQLPVISTHNLNSANTPTRAGVALLNALGATIHCFVFSLKSIMS